MWVVQEAVLAKEIFFMSESQITSWKSMIDILEHSWRVISQNGNTGSSEMTYNELEIHRLCRPAAFLEKLREARSYFDEHSSSQSLDSMLWDCRHRDLGVQHDRVYALLGICSPYDIVPDYSKCLDDVLVEASRAIVSSYAKLDRSCEPYPSNPLEYADFLGRLLLSCPAHPLEHVALFHRNTGTVIRPSWISEYDASSSQSLFENYDPFISAYSADADLCLSSLELTLLVLQAAEQSTGRQLQVLRLEVDELAWISPTPLWITWPGRTMSEWWRKVQHYARGHGLAERFVRTVFTDRGQDRRSRLPRPSSTSFSDFCEEWVQRWLENGNDED